MNHNFHTARSSHSVAALASSGQGWRGSPRHPRAFTKTGIASAILLSLPFLIGAPSCEQSQSRPEGPSAWVGHAYLVTPADPYTYLTEPQDRTLRRELAKFIPNFLLKVHSATSDQVLLTIAPAVKQTTPPEQDLCTVTVEASATVSSYPKIQIGPMDIPLYVTNAPEGKASVTARIVVREFSLSDILPNGGTVPENGAFSALVDIREVAPLLTNMAGLSPQEVCSVIKDSFATDCVPCPDSQVLCLSFQAEDLGATDADTKVKSISDSDLVPSCPKP